MQKVGEGFVNKGTKISLHKQLDKVEYLENRTPEMAFSGGAEKAFSEIAKYRDGAIYVGHYSGNSEWEKHTQGDELVMVLAGETTLVMLAGKTEEQVRLQAGELLVVPQNTWHRFEDSRNLKVMTITPQPTDHSIEWPGV